MIKYTVKRLLWMIPVLLGVSFLIMAIMEFCPGDPAKIMLGIDATEENIAQLNVELGLDDPFLVRYGRFVVNAFQFEFGTSYTSGDSIRDQILFRIPFTLTISLVSLVISVLIGIPCGVIAATHQYSLRDNLTMLAALFCVSMPVSYTHLTLPTKLEV